MRSDLFAKLLTSCCSAGLRPSGSGYTTARWVLPALLARSAASRGSSLSAAAATVLWQGRTLSVFRSSAQQRPTPQLSMQHSIANRAMGLWPNLWHSDQSNCSQCAAPM
jgi:hypothetical protein